MSERPRLPARPEPPAPPSTPEALEESRAEWTREDDELLLLDEIEDRPDDDIDDLV